MAIILIDTSCLLRLPNTADPRRIPTQNAITRLGAKGGQLVVLRQNLTEFRGVATRPIAVNGLGLTPEQADAELDILERLLPRLPEHDAVYDVWRDLCRRAGVSGKQVHDTRIVAACVDAGVSAVLTWNPSDFLRFVRFVPGFQVWTPEDVLAR